tara:strand:- start:408 stop:662 length:255 start_codon:yes stop_codon:yes gene_type:complete
MITYLSLLLISFFAATIFPLSSELALASLINTNRYNLFVLIGMASLGNILGSVFNWFLGFYLFKYIKKNGFLLKKSDKYCFKKI